MRMRLLITIFALIFIWLPAAFSQTKKPLSNADILEMTKQGFEPPVIVTLIQTSETDFDVSTQALVDLKNSGVAQPVLEAMLAAQGGKVSGSSEAAHGKELAVEPASVDSSQTGCGKSKGCLLRETTQVNLKFAADVNSKTAHVGDPVEFVLDEDLKVGDSVVVSKGAHAVAMVSWAKKAGMVGKPGDLSVQLEYLIAGDNHVHLRGTQGREGESKIGSAVALTLIFGPVELIKHGKNVDIPPGTPLQAYVDQDIWLPPVN
jgi:hypothetical protein